MEEKDNENLSIDEDKDNINEWESKRGVNKLFKIFKSIPNAKAYKYLKHAKTKYESFITKFPPVRPLGGQSFLYESIRNLDNKTRIEDQYCWVTGQFSFNKANSIKRQTYYIKTSNPSEAKRGIKVGYSNEFKRIVYFYVNNEPTIIYFIIYIGNHEKFKDQPHGNRK